MALSLTKRFSPKNMRSRKDPDKIDFDIKEENFNIIEKNNSDINITHLVNEYSYIPNKKQKTDLKSDLKFVKEVSPGDNIDIAKITSDVNDAELTPVGEVAPQESALKTSDVNDAELTPVGEVAPQESALKTSDVNDAVRKYINQKYFSLIDLMLFCEEHLHILLFNPIEQHLLKRNAIEKQYVYSILELYSNYSEVKTFSLKNSDKQFQDTFYYSNGKVIVTEELYEMTGFMRKYFDITEVYVIYNNGEILLKKSKWCDFWDEKRLYKVLIDPKYNIQRPEISPKYSKELVCQNCNLVCNFRNSTNV